MWLMCSISPKEPGRGSAASVIRGYMGGLVHPQKGSSVGVCLTCSKRIYGLFGPSSKRILDGCLPDVLHEYLWVVWSILQKDPRWVCSSPPPRGSMGCLVHPQKGSSMGVFFTSSKRIYGLFGPSSKSILDGCVLHLLQENLCVVWSILQTDPRSVSSAPSPRESLV